MLPLVGPRVLNRPFSFANPVQVLGPGDVLKVDVQDSLVYYPEHPEAAVNSSFAAARFHLDSRLILLLHPTTELQEPIRRDLDLPGKRL